MTTTPTPTPTGPQHVVVFGRPGSGKSTLAERLGLDHGYSLVRTGELLRAAVRAGDFLGRRVEAHLAKGDLVPDPLIFELMVRDLVAPGSARLLFDGFPRTIGQVDLMDQFEARLGFEIEAFLDVSISREAAVARMTGRRVCPLCGSTYHVLSQPPLVPDVCDRDGHPLDRRADDKADVIAFRQKVYDDHAPAILDHYRAAEPGRFHRIDGSGPLDRVYRAALVALGLSAES